MRTCIVSILILFNSIFCPGQTGIQLNSNPSPMPVSPLISGHRGGFDTDFPENSYSMFDYTINNACNKPIIIEFDIRESASGKLFVMHDVTVDRTTNGTGNIGDLSDEYIYSLFQKDRNNNLTTGKIPIFEELLLYYHQKEVMLMLDIKGNIHKKVLELVRSMEMENQCIFLTFMPEFTSLCCKYSDQIQISSLVTNLKEWQFLKTLITPDNHMIAYITNETPEEIINLMLTENVSLMTDMSENNSDATKRLEPEIYRSIVTDKHLDILITDYPVLVSNIFCSD